MSTPFVCEVCGGAITLGRHRSGWRHVSDDHTDHRVRKIARDEYRKAAASLELSDAPIEDENREDAEDSDG